MIPRLRRFSCVASLFLPLACQSSRVSPDGTLIRVENHQVVPPNYFALINASHPRYTRAELVPPLHKIIPDDLMEGVLEVIENEGFQDFCESIPTPASRVEALPILRRLSVTHGDRTLALTVPRRPPKELAEVFSSLARQLGAVFNEVNFLRPDRPEIKHIDEPDPGNRFEREQRRLEALNRRKRTGSGR